MASFDLSRLDRFAGNCTSIRRPREFAYFSFDDDHFLKPLSAESLSYYYPPLFGAPGSQEERPDLSTGFDTFKQRDDSIDEHLDALLDTLQAHEERLLEKVAAGEAKLEDVKAQADVVTWRGMMTKILTAAFDNFGDFEMNATCYQGTIFIEENHQYKASQKHSQNRQPPRKGQPPQDLMQYWGYRFETLSVLPRTWAECSRDEIEGRESAVTSNFAQYCSIVKTGIGSTSLVIGGEVDAVLGEKPANPDDPIPWVELKTTQEADFSNFREVVKFERKLLRFWAQSFLLGVPKIELGYRTQDGVLTRISELETQRIPSMVKRGSRTWDGNVCINLTAAFLAYLKEQITEGAGVFRISRKTNSPLIEITRLEESGPCRIVKDSFKQHREKLQAMFEKS